MKKFLIIVLLLLCIELFLASCDKSPTESETTPITITIFIPDTNGTSFIFTGVYPEQFNPMSGDAEMGKGYLFNFKENGMVTCDKPFGIYKQGSAVNDYKDEEILLFEARETFVLKTGEFYRTFIYADGNISAEYEPYPEPHPSAMLNFQVISEEEYKIMLEEKNENVYGKKYLISNLSGE